MRWGNVAKALALTAVVALVVAWPRLRAADPEIPPGAAVPVRQAPATTVATPPEQAALAPEAVREERKPTAKPRRHRRRSGRQTRHRRRATTPARPAPAPPPPAPTWRAPARAPAEFSVE